jgi:hypothetical protein
MCSTPPTGGALSITVPTGTVNLGSVSSVEGGTISGHLGEVQVTDTRGAADADWVASVIASALTLTPGTTIPASAIGYTPGDITKVGMATYTPTDSPSLEGIVVVVAATGIAGDNSATWNPTVKVSVPGAMAAGTYTGTITHSVV